MSHIKSKSESKLTTRCKEQFTYFAITLKRSKYKVKEPCWIKGKFKTINIR